MSMWYIYNEIVIHIQYKIITIRRTTSGRDGWPLMKTILAISTIKLYILTAVKCIQCVHISLYKSRPLSPSHLIFNEFSNLRLWHKQSYRQNTSNSSAQFSPCLFHFRYENGINKTINNAEPQWISHQQCVFFLCKFICNDSISSGVKQLPLNASILK